MPRPTTSRRDRVYELLVEAGERGVLLRQLGEAGIPCSKVHMESLRFEGHVISERGELRTEGGGYQARFFLVKDAWAEG